MVDTRRWPRVRQRGVDCSVAGCSGDRVSNDFCAKHNMRRHRRTEKGAASVKAYNKRYKRPDIEKVCKCGEVFVTARANQERCGECIGKKEVSLC